MAIVDLTNKDVLLLASFTNKNKTRYTMQVGLAAKDMLARESDLTLYRQLSCFTLQVFSCHLTAL